MTTLNDADKAKFVLSKLLGPQVGSKIRILQNEAWAAPVKEGEIGIIGEVMKHGFKYRINGQPIESYWFMPTEETYLYELCLIDEEVQS